MPFFTRPLPDELFSSWLIRNAHKHNTKVHTFCKFLWPGVQIWNRDIDKSVTADVLHDLARITCTPIRRAQLTTLKKYEGVLFERFLVKTHCEGITPAGIRHRTRKNNAQLFCPYCLGKGTPYFRCSWRLSLIVVCPGCGIYLQDACPECSEMIIPFRLDLGRKHERPALSIKHCWNCFFDLSLSPAIPADRRLLNFQREITGMISASLMHKNAAALSYLKGVYFLAAFLNRMHRRQQRDRARIFDHLSLDHKVRVFTELAELLDAWPEKFVRLMSERKYRFSDFIPEIDQRELVPYWLYRVLYDHFFYGSFTNTRYHKVLKTD